MTIKLKGRLVEVTVRKKERPVCEFKDYDFHTVSFTLMSVDGISVRLLSEKTIIYFKSHYRSLGYDIKVVTK